MVELATNCCGCFSLAQGVTIVAGLDLVSASSTSTNENSPFTSSAFQDDHACACALTRASGP
jgi:hypothetical protein